MAYTFDGPNKRIYLPIGPTTLDLVDLHSRWKDWVLAGNAQYLPAFGTVGGEIIDIPLYLFERNGWLTVLPAANQVLNVIGGVYVKEGEGDPFIDAVGSYSVHINRQVPGIAIGYSSEGGGVAPTVDAIASEIMLRIDAKNFLTVTKFIGLS